MRLLFLALVLAPITVLAEEYRAAGCPDVPAEAAPVSGVAYRPGSSAGGWPVPAADATPPVLTEEDIGVVQIVPEIPLTNYVDRHPRGQFDPSRTGVYPGTIAQDLRTGETYWNDRKIAPLPATSPCDPASGTDGGGFDYSTGN